MGAFVNTLDFRTGTNQVAFSTGTMELQLDGFITQFETQYLAMIFGIELANDLKVYQLGGGSGNVELDLLIAPLTVNYGRTTLSSNGLVSILKGFIRSEYLKENQKMILPTGVAVNKGENVNMLSTANFYGYNENIMQGRAIQRFIQEHSADYPTFRYSRLETIDPIW